ncbi:MAG: 3-hydroxyacyl-CoA dehydrogenase NAD-binding domain-containing protein [Hyphococcus sp.]
MSVSTRIADSVLVISIDNPPVNALGADVRKGLSDALEQVEKNQSIKAVVLTGAGKFFSGGADIKEFGKAPVAPFLPDLLLRLEACRAATVAAINGVALGGGLETALACRYRIASAKATMGLPEVRLGIIPGAGGTQRLPRLVGVKDAADMITSGKPVDAAQALDMGLVDAIEDSDLVGAAIAMALDKASGDARPSLSDIERPQGWDADWLDAYAAKLKSRARGQLSPMKALEAVRASGELAFADGLKRERDIFADCMASDQRKGLIHSFFAERIAKRAPEIEGVEARPVGTIGVLGAGTMGAGIAIACAASGYTVKLFDANADALKAGLQRVKQTFERDASKGRMFAADAEAATKRVIPADSIEAMRDADLFIEAVIEKMDVKKSVFAVLDAVAKPDVVLASNTSYLNIDEIAGATKRPENVVGMHFFSPANIMRLLEIVKAEKASRETLATAFAVGAKLGKINVFSGVCDGFIGNRILKTYRRQADYLVEDGAMPEDIDRVMREFGFAMGPFQVSDLAGLDIGWHNRRREDATRDRQERYVAIADKLYEMGRLGQKSGAGWYRYEKGDRAPHPDPQVKELILAASKEKGIDRREISDDEIRDRIIFSMINEGAKVLGEGVASRAVDIDLVFLHGYGFPAYRGGPMFYASQIGLDEVLRKIRAFEQDDPYSWAPADLIVEYVKQKQYGFDYG